MDKTFFFFYISTAILILTIIVICISPIINNVGVKEEGINFTFSSWRTNNCKFLSDKINSDEIGPEILHNLQKMKNLCYRKKAMYDLEYASLFIDVVLGFLCAYLSLLHCFHLGTKFIRKTGMIGVIGGTIGFIITLVCICYNGYIFNNDIAFGEVDFAQLKIISGIEKLFSNGATHKCIEGKYFTPDFNDKDDYSKYIKYKDLGKKQYNYNSEFYGNYYVDQTSSCKTTAINCTINCNYLYASPPKNTFQNKNLYDRWMATLIMNIFIDICFVGVIILGVLLFKDKENSNYLQTDSSDEK